MLLRCCLIHVSITILGKILYLIYLCLCLCLGPFMLYLCDIFFIFNLIFIVIDHITSFKQTHFLSLYIFQNFSYYFMIITRMKKANNFQITKVQPQGVAQLLLVFFCQFQPGVAYKCVAFKRVIQCLCRSCLRPFVSYIFSFLNFILYIYTLSIHFFL